MIKDDVAPSHAFWDLVALTGGRCDEESLVPLRVALAALPDAQVAVFGVQFGQALAAIGTSAHAAQDVRDVSEDPESPALPMSADVFQDARCAVVAAGRHAWERVAADPVALRGVWFLSDGELLLGLVADAYEEATGGLWAQECEPDAGDVAPGGVGRVDFRVAGAGPGFRPRRRAAARVRLGS